MTELVPRQRADVQVRPIGGSLRQVTGTDAQIAAYLDAQIAQGVRVRLSESRRPGPGGTVIRVVELIPPAKRGPAPWWLIGSGILLTLAVIGAVAIMGMQALVAHPIAALIAVVLIVVFGGGTTIVFNFNRR